MLMQPCRKDNLTASLADDWRIDVHRHVLPKVGYKGAQLPEDPERIQVSFDALTLPAVFFTESQPNAVGIISTCLSLHVSSSFILTSTT